MQRGNGQGKRHDAYPADRAQGGEQVGENPAGGDQASKGLEDASRHLRPVAAELLEATAKLTDEGRAAVGKYLEEVVTELFARHARG